MRGALSYHAAAQPRTKGVPALGRYHRHYAGGGEVDTDTAPDQTDTDQTQPGALARVADQGPDQDGFRRAQDLRNVRAILAADNNDMPPIDNFAAVTGRPPIAGPGGPPAVPPPVMPPMTQPDTGAATTGGSVNLPLLMAAGAMMKGGHPGGFGADLGAGFEAGAQGLEKQRQLEENSKLRQAQMANTAAYQQGVLNVRNQHEDNYAAVSQARAAELSAQASHLMARAMGGLAGKVTEAQLESQAIEEAMKGDNTRLLLLQQARTTAAAATNAATNQGRLSNTLSQQDWMRQNRVTDQEMTQAQRYLAQNNKLDPLGRPTNPPISLDDALAKVRSVRGPGGGGGAPRPAGGGGPPAAPPAAPAADPLAAARAAIASGAPRAAVIQRLKDNGVDPGGL